MIRCVLPCLPRLFGCLPFLAGCLALLWSGSAEAHPHAWIDIRSGLVFDDAGDIEAIEEEWFFDTMYSTLIQDEVPAHGRAVEDVLDELAQVNLASLADYDYFTVVTADDADVALLEVTEYETAMRGDRLWMKFRVPLAEPIDPSVQKVSYAIYDPSYYVEMLHLEGEPIMLTGGDTGSCTATLERADPTFDAVALAAAFDQTQTGPADLGALFADRVHVTCE